MRRAGVFLVIMAAVWGMAGCASTQARRGNGIPGQELVAAARKQIGVAYRFGGKSPEEGFDCSGLVDYCYRGFGVKLPHSAEALYGEGNPVKKGSLKPGDLVFFDITGRGVSHVGIYSGGDHMIHAPSSGGKVREDLISIKYWLRRYIGARRLE